MAVNLGPFKTVKLQECATFQEGYVNPSQGIAEYFGNDVKWLRAVDLNDSFVWETSRRLSRKGFESAGKAALLFEPDTLAISKSGTIGRLGILKDYMCGNRAVINIRPEPSKCDTRYIFYSLLIRRAEIETRAVGSVQPNLYCSALGDIDIRVPPLAEQSAIAAVLGSLDDKIELNRRMNATLEAMARALFQSWFVDFDPVRAKLDGREPYGLDPATAALFPDSFQDSELGRIPKGWSATRVSEMCERIFSGGTPSTQVPHYWGGDLPWLSSGETRNRFIIDTEKTITKAGVANSSTRLARPGSTVIAGAGQGHTRGQTSLLTFESYINQSVVALAANPATSSDLYLFFDLARRYEEFRQLSDSHSSRGSLTTKLLAGIPCILPREN